MKQRANLRSPLFLQYASRPAEAEATNQLLRSEEFDNSSWTKSNTTITANQVDAPDGTLTADKLTENSSTTNKFVYQNSSITADTKYTMSVFAKSNGNRYIQLAGSTGFDSYAVNYDLQEGVIAYNPNNIESEIEDYGNGWFRISYTDISTPSGAPSGGRILITLISSEISARAESYLGDGVSGVYIWGAQLEQGEYTSYIKTEGSTETRTATTAAQEEDVTAELRIYNGGGGYNYERTNYATNNTSMDTYSALGGSSPSPTLTADYITAPDGTLTATRFQASTTGSSYSLISFPTTALGNGDYTTSVYVKSNTGSNQTIAFYGQSSAPNTREVTTEWTRIEFTGNRGAGLTKFAYLGTWASNLGTDADLDISIWGAQLEVDSSQATSLIYTEGSAVTELAYQTEAPTEATYTLTRTPNNAKATFEVSELVRDYIEQTLENTSGTTWLEVTLSDSIQLPRHYHFLCTEGYIDNTEGLQTYLNAPSNETFMQSNSTVLIPEGESLQIPVNAQYNSFYAFDRTNLVADSENFDSSYYSVFNGASVSNGITSPSGCNNAYNLETNGSSFSFIKPASNITVTNGETYTFSIFVKANQIDTGYLRLDYGSTIYNRKFNLSTESFSTGFDNTGNIPNNETIKNYYNGWYRVSITDVVNTTSFEARLYVSGSSGATSGDSLYIYGAQLENNSKATSYVKGVQNDNAINYFSNLDDNTTQIEYITVNSGDESVKLYVDSVVTEEITIQEIDNSKYANNKLLFVNKYGAKQEFYVNMKSTEKIRVKDDGFSRNVIDYTNLSVTNGLHSYKRRVLESKEMHTLNTPFLDEENVQAFEELLLSEYVWYKKEGADYIPVIIKESNMTRKTHLNDKLIQYTIEVESANNLINIQR